MDQYGSNTPDLQTPSAQFLEVAQRLADLLAEDIAKVVSGAALTHRGVTFSLKHHGALDPAAMVLAVEAGPLTERTQAQACKAFLRCNLASPAVTGYYAVLPDRDTIVWCVRIDFSNEPNPVGKVAFLLEQLANGKEVFGDVIRQAVQKAFRRGESQFASV